VSSLSLLSTTSVPSQPHANTQHLTTTGRHRCLTHHPHLLVPPTHHLNTCHAPCNITHNTGAHTGAIQPHATMTPVPRSPPLTCQCHLWPPQHIGAPLHLQHHSRHHPATPITAQPQHLSCNIVLRVKWKARAIW